MVPGTVEAGQTVTVSCTDFQPGEALQFTLGATLLGTGTAAADGTCDETLTIPANTPVGAAQVQVAGPGSAPATAALTITAAPAVPAVTVSPGTVKAGQGITASCTGFQPGEALEFRLGGTLIGSGTAATDGTCNEHLNIPSTAAAGATEVRVTGPSSAPATAALIIEPAPTTPIDPTPIGPTNPATPTTPPAANPTPGAGTGAAAGATKTATLAETGAELTPLLTTALILILGGTGTYLTRLRRRKATLPH